MIGGPAAVGFLWLLRLRWTGLLGQAVLMLIADLYLGVQLPLPTLFSIVAVGAATNLVAWSWMLRTEHAPLWLMGSLMATDIILFTAMLYVAGGPANPFSILFLVHVVLVTVAMPPGWAWGLVVIALSGFGLLFLVEPWPLLSESGLELHDMMHQHMNGMWLAFLVASAFVVWFVQRLRQSLSIRDGELATARLSYARHERLAALATLSAGAAHELAQPLSTIAVAAKELLRRVEALPDGDDAADDARLIRSQVDRCRSILDRMAAEAGAKEVEAPAPLPVGELVASVLDGLETVERLRTDVRAHATATLWAPRVSLGQALRSVIENALQATAGGGEVKLTIWREDGFWNLEVADTGSGMPSEVAARACEPFFTTKGPGAGMGLGLFLTRAVVERLDGHVAIHSSPGAGSRITLRIPDDDL